MTRSGCSFNSFSVFLLCLKQQQNLMKIMFSCNHFPVWPNPPKIKIFILFYTGKVYRLTGINTPSPPPQNTHILWVFISRNSHTHTHTHTHTQHNKTDPHMFHTCMHMHTHTHTLNVCHEESFIFHKSGVYYSTILQFVQTSRGQQTLQQKQVYL